MSQKLHLQGIFWLIISLPISLAASPQLTQATLTGPEQASAASILNSFIASFAKVEVDWKKDIAFISSPNDVPPGKQLGYSPIIGYYSFTPKLWNELTPIQQQAVLRDPRLSSYIVSLRNPTGMPAYQSLQAYPTTQAEPTSQVYPNHSTAPQTQAKPTNQGYQSYPTAQAYPTNQSYPTAQAYPTNQSYPTAQAYPTNQSYSTAQAYPTNQSYSTAQAYPTNQSYSTAQAYPTNQSYPTAQAYPTNQSYPTAQAYPTNQSYPTAQAYPTNQAYSTAQAYPTNQELSKPSQTVEAVASWAPTAAATMPSQTTINSSTEKETSGPIAVIRLTPEALAGDKPIKVNLIP
jgi:hypothetical protein